MWNIACKNQLKFPGVIHFKIDSYSPSHEFNCSQACVLNAHLKQGFPFLSVAGIRIVRGNPGVKKFNPYPCSRVSVLEGWVRIFKGTGVQGFAQGLIILKL